ncbi:Alpha-tubulin N-acetyltransferase 2 [Toxocara canis]|uniref:Alpha-tubulin N-acetyltransferase n=1 Tax=Toxocara canis TaxID=6265 RepID=A0A0B2VXL5_TOXCA|nr:Alpha-tubulin N-acetyltransferase 2 [Toxocara canis]
MMEVPFDLEEFFEDAPIQRLDLNTLRRLNPRKCWPVQKAIDRMGALSAEAQGLKRVLTSYDKLIDSDDGQVLYLMWKKDPNHEKSSIVIGILKIGYKCLYLMDASMKTFKTTPLCILDFYVHDTLQRRGNGHALFEYMIQHEGSSVEKVAIDKPSDSLLQFMNKYYALTNPLWQSTNYVVYAPFFDFLRPSDEVDDNRKQLVSSKTEALMQNEKQKPQRARMHDSVAGIMYGGSSIPKRVLAAPDTPQGRKNARDFGHQTIW